MRRKILIMFILSMLINLAFSTVSSVLHATVPESVGHPPRGGHGGEG